MAGQLLLEQLSVEDERSLLGLGNLDTMVFAIIKISGLVEDWGFEKVGKICFGLFLILWHRCCIKLSCNVEECLKSRLRPKIQLPACLNSLKKACYYQEELSLQ